MSVLTYSRAINRAMHEEMLRDQKVILLGEDIAVMEGVWGCSKGFLQEFGPWRVLDTPICENGFVGMAVGAAMRGLRPIVELMYSDFAPMAFDSIANQAAKMHYMTGGQIKIPLVLRAPNGVGRRNAGQHSGNLEALLTHIPGLKVICPSTPYDVMGMLKTAIRDEDPVMCIENKLLYSIKGEVPDEEYLIPLGQADIKRPGKDLTIISWSREVHYCLQAAADLALKGIDAEVLDLRSLVPLDWDAIVRSVSKTHRVLIVHEAVKRGGYGGEIAAQIGEELFDELDAPVKRVAGANVVIPFSPALEDLIYPQVADIVQGALEVLA